MFDENEKKFYSNYWKRRWYLCVFVSRIRYCKSGKLGWAGKTKLKEAIEMFLEDASATEVQERLHSELFITQLEVVVGEA